MAAEPACPEPELLNGRGHNSERPTYRQKKKKKLYCAPAIYVSHLNALVLDKILSLFTHETEIVTLAVNIHTGTK